MEKLTDLEQTLDDLHPLIQECLNASNPDMIASKNIHLAFTLNTLYLLKLRLNGQSLKGHPIKEEIARIKEYFKKLEYDNDTASMKLDKDAAKRFVKSALSNK
jgi:exosome complex protein LRP1